ncbi:MAG: thioredoxin domain-containing protein [Desulfobulbaceae bacterium]|nr:thioredoxin domain-containing protein [Desulfobulbaceae bacterium]
MRIKTFFLMTFFCVMGICLTAQAKVDSEMSNSFKAANAPLDLASSVNGKYVFVLSKGSVGIYTNDGKLVDAIAVDPSFNHISVSGLDLANIEDKIFLSSESTGNVQELSYSFIVSIDTTNAPFLGMPNAPVNIVIFSDFQCPYCSKLGPTFDALLKKNPQTVKISYKHFPIRGHAQAIPAALAAIAAQKQGKFWQYHDLLFQNMRDLNPEKLLELATSLGLNMDQFKKDMADPQSMAQVSKDQQDGVSAGVKGTPSIFINGRIAKDRTDAGMQKLIDEELAKTRSNK